MNKQWNELKDWLQNEINNKRLFSPVYYEIVLLKMKQIDDAQYWKSLEEGGY